MSWKLLILDMGYKPAEVLRLARLPADLLTRKDASLSTGEYFQFWRGLEQVAGSDEIALKLSQAMTVEAFDPALFACLCSPDLNTALQRLAQYKRLIGPLNMAVDINSKRTLVTLDCYADAEPIPRSLGVSELVFFTQLARLATRERLEPMSASCPELPEHPDLYRAYFGCALGRSSSIRIVFEAHDARRPFLTENMAMWEAFEPALKSRLSELDEQALMQERVRSVLLEMLPAGSSDIDGVARRLGLSKRSLQRHLAEEALSFQEVLNQVRQDLAQHYLSNTQISTGEISWLLGFQEGNSFIRAFRSWTGTTPAAFRQGHEARTPEWH